MMPDKNLTISLTIYQKLIIVDLGYKSEVTEGKSLFLILILIHLQFDGFELKVK
jgi:hypothetical protein